MQERGGGEWWARNKRNRRTPFLYIPSVLCPHLDTEATRLPLSTSLLELATLVLVVDTHIRLLAGAGCARRLAEMLVHLTGLQGATQKHAVRASGSAQGKLIEGDKLTAGRGDTGAGVVGGAEAAHSELKHAVVKDTDIVGHGSNNNSDLPLLSLHLLGDLRDRHGRAVSP